MISEATRQAAGEGLPARELGRIRVVGRQQAVRVYELASKGPAAAAESRSAFAAALALCYAGKLTEAVAAFAALTDDPVAGQYRDRCRLALDEGADSFDGTWNLAEK